MKTYFEKVKKNFGFGCMRLPMKKIDENTSIVDYEEFSKMIDEFILTRHTAISEERVRRHFVTALLNAIPVRITCL